MSSLNKVGNRHKAYQMAKSKTTGRYLKQRDRTALNKIKHITNQITISTGTHLNTLNERLKFWQLTR